MYPITWVASPVSVFHHSADHDAKIVSTEQTTLTSTLSKIRSFAANPCASNPCGSNGQCIQSSGGFFCECNLGYYGNRCEREYRLDDVLWSARRDSLQVECVFPIHVPTVERVNHDPMACSNVSVHLNFKDSVVNFVSATRIADIGYRSRTIPYSRQGL